MLPADAVAELKKDNAKVEPKFYDHASVLITDFVDFAKQTDKMKGDQMVDILREYFDEFNNIVEKFNMKKIRITGDSYMAVSGLQGNEESHALNCVKAAVKMKEFVEQLNSQKKVLGQTFFEMRVGVHSGTVVAGVFDRKNITYDVTGDTVSVTSRLEKCSAPGRINISEITRNLVADYFEFEPRNNVEVKGLGYMDMYYVIKSIE
jgi:class 3 adenylate cyclase